MTSKFRRSAFLFLLLTVSLLILASRTAIFSALISLSESRSDLALYSIAPLSMQIGGLLSLLVAGSLIRRFPPRRLAQTILLCGFACTSGLFFSTMRDGVRFCCSSRWHYAPPPSNRSVITSSGSLRSSATSGPGIHYWYWPGSWSSRRQARSPACCTRFPGYGSISCWQAALHCYRCWHSAACRYLPLDSVHDARRRWTTCPAVLSATMGRRATESTVFSLPTGRRSGSACRIPGLSSSG